MGRGRKRIVTDIPSDSESVDGLGDSETEDTEPPSHVVGRSCVVGNRRDVDTNLVSNLIEDDDDTDEDTDNEGESNNLAIERWKKATKVKDDLPFTADFGPKLPDNIKTPLQIFLCLFPHELLDKIVAQTNLYAVQNKRKGDPITKDELLIFLGLNILMGVKKLPSYRDYWSSNPQLNDNYVASKMTVTRFGFFLGNLHMADNNKEPTRNDPNFDRLYKIRPMLDKLNDTYKLHWGPSKYQSVDESMIKFKGRSTLKQYMPAKPIKRGYKCWVRADESGYICEFEIYVGKKERVEKGLGPRVVTDLTRDLVGKNHHVYFDNYFTSVGLMIQLKKDNIFACGTVRKDRVRLPKSEIPDKNMGHGAYEWKTSNTGIRWVKWMDKKPVQFLSNYHDPSDTTTVSRREKNGSLKEVSSPVICSDYNRYMGFVDKSDQLISTYKIDRKSKKWWHRIFWHFIDATVVNAFLIYKQMGVNRDMSSKTFRLKLVEEMVGHKLPTKKGRKRTVAETNFSKPQVSSEKRRCQSAHLPIHMNCRRRCAHCSTKAHTKRTIWKCSTCDVPLCIKPDSNCFLSFHT